MAGQIPAPFIDDLLARIDIVDVIDDRVALKKKGKDFLGLCPFHGEKTPSFTVSPSKQFYYCFGCGASGSALGFLMEFDRLDFVAAVEELANRVGMQVPQSDIVRGQKQSAAPLYEQLEKAQSYLARQLREHPAASKAVEYLKSRGVSGEAAASFGIGFAPPGWDNLLKTLGRDERTTRLLEQVGLLIAKDNGHYDRFRDRITFPIHDQRGRVVGFGGRVLGADEPKYLNSPETPVFQKGRELYGLHRARKAQRDLVRLLVVEGYMDVVALAQFNINNAVATLGTATTAEHLQRLFKSAPEIVFCFDGDSAGRRAAERAMDTSLPLLSDAHSVGFLFLPAGHDPDTLVRAEGAAFFEDAGNITPLSEFLLDTLCAEVNMESLDGRARLVDLARPALEKVPRGAFKLLLSNRLAELARLPVAKLNALLAVETSQPAAPPSPPRRSRRQSPSLVRLAVTLLLHQPDLAMSVAAPGELRDVDQPGIPLLVELLELVRSKPDINSGSIVEHWRGTEHAARLSKLLGAELPVPEDGLQHEFMGAIKRLLELRSKARRDALSAARPSELSDSEKAELRAALLRHAEQADDANPPGEIS